MGMAIGIISNTNPKAANNIREILSWLAFRKYFKLSKKLPEAHPYLSRSNAERSVTHEIEGEDAPKQASNSELSKAILSSLSMYSMQHL